MSDHILATPFGYYLRVTVPKDLRLHLGKREIKKSLATHDRKRAIQAAQLLLKDVEQLFASLRGGPMAWRRKSAIPGFTEIIERDIGPNGLVIRELEMDMEEYFQLHPEKRPQAPANLLVPIQPVAATPTFITPPKISIQPTLQTRIDGYLKEKKRQELVTGSMTALRRTFDLLIEYFGDVPMSEITRDEAGEFINVLCKLPPNRHKLPDYKDIPIRDIALMTDSLIAKKEAAQKNGKKYKKFKVLSVVTINDQIDDFQALWEWAFSQDRTLTNPFRKQKLPESSAVKRLPFTTGHLDVIFRNEIFMHKMPQMRLLHPHHFFVPLIGVYSGMRLDEICQLHLEDIEKPHGIWVFNINKKHEKKLKNNSSERVVPIHSALIDVGLLEYVNELKREGETRLFPNLVLLPSKNLGVLPYSHSVSQWFGTFLKRINIKTDELVFHSFRHTFANSYKQKKFDETTVGELLGHAHAKITFGVYTVAHQHQTLKDAIEELDLGINVAVLVKPYTAGALPWAAAQRRLRRESGDPFLKVSKSDLESAIRIFNRPKTKI